MIKYEISIKNLSPKHFNSARYSYEVKVVHDGHPCAGSGAYGCTLTLSGAKRMLQKELRMLESRLSPNAHTIVVIAEGSIKDLEKLL